MHIQLKGLISYPLDEKIALRVTKIANRMYFICMHLVFAKATTGL